MQRFQLSIFCLLAGCFFCTHQEDQEIPFLRPGDRSTASVCGPGRFPCGNTSVCIERKLHCDGIQHCDNGTDEEGCEDAHGSVESILREMQNKYVIDLTKKSLVRNCSLENMPSKCSCRMKTWLHCPNLNLTELPRGLEGGVTNLILPNNSISEITPNIIQSYTSLRVIQLANNKIKKIEEGTFTGMKNLGLLFLTGNLLESIQPGAFKGLSNLTWLMLQGNRIHSFDPLVLEDLPSLHILDISNNALTLKDAVLQHRNIYWLQLEKNRIEKIEKNTFANLESLEVLALKHNEINEIDEEAFHKLHLVEIDLSYNRIAFMKPRLFYNLRKLSKLNIEWNPIASINIDLFQQLVNLKSLELRGIEISNINTQHFRTLTKLEFIYFKKFHYCSYAPYVRLCFPKTDGLSSTEHLLVWPVLRLSVWVVALVTCIGNTVVLTWRILSRKEDRVLSLFIKNLSVADFIMGVYLLAIASQDIILRDNYNQHAHMWMSSLKCTLCGVLAMVSCEVSVLILSLITVERYRCIRTNVRVVTERAAKYSLVVVWSVGWLLAIFPVVHWNQERGSFYSSNGLCFPLHIDDAYMDGWQYSAFVFLGVNFLVVLLIVTLYLWMFLLIKHDRQMARPIMLKQREDAVLAMRFFFIVLTDCLCWIPIIIIKLAALSELPISENLYAFVVVFILPVNSALNPVIYTLAAPTELRRRISNTLQKAFLCKSRLSFSSAEIKVPNSSVATNNSYVTEARSTSNGSVSVPSSIKTSITTKLIALKKIKAETRV